MNPINPRYEAIFDVRSIDQDCDKRASLMRNESRHIREAMDAGLYKQAVNMYLQLLNSMCKHFVEDEHYCYFDDLYSPEYVMQSIYEDFQMHDLGFEASTLLKQGHDEVLQSESYEDYGMPSYL